MNEAYIIDFIASCFNLEISNHFEVDKNQIVVFLSDKTKAKITTKNM